MSRGLVSLARRLSWPANPFEVMPVRFQTIPIVVVPVLLLVGSTPQAAPQDAVSEETVTYFRNNCVSCHTIGGGVLTGPDLKGVTDREDRAWLIEFIQDPKAAMDRGDAHALELLSEANGALMPTIPTLTPEMAEKLLHLIEVESALEKSHFAGLQLSDRPLTEADVARGRELFLGHERFQNGAPSCVSCHSVMGIGGL
ncbi:MAG TPA: cytochrome c, partial [Planctomycetes bacterium]|nr:cytochrome c [Planctomycetota bacterium]